MKTKASRGAKDVCRPPLFSVNVAGEFVTEPRYLDMLAARAPRGWEKKNLQVVLATEVVRGNTGPPHILATHFW